MEPLPQVHKSRTAPGPKPPPWLKVRLTQGENYLEIKNMMRSETLHTVCEEALCPNIYECWEARTATFLILGDICTRNCGFCAITTGRPTGLDLLEPKRVAQTTKRMGLKHVVITSVTRDDLPDGGAQIFVGCIEEIRREVPGCGVEVLIPDLMGNWKALERIVEARPDILNHNTESVPRLYPWVRPKARYERTMELLRRVKQQNPDVVTKSGIMVGLGETREEIRQVLEDMRENLVDVLTVGQYLRPDQKHLPVERYYTPDEFREIKVEAEALGFRHVEAGPLVRSSYHAASQVPKEV
ncbi:lipoyl synthase [Sulfobacillus harzensis]|uniref:Lipoyl synthase n=1 Tax=Sulfobacillus harzensis TaxID=2729629 RepID=A0A7Y0L1D8_9FIRM|nr:lipoyl synthase [Sulfobacillus harzensis]NMP20966.1 lipoyl synthase [Sulfobacillus harzensis]